MKVERNELVGSASEIQRAERQDKQQAAAPARPVSSDRIEWSPRAAELAKLREAALEAPDVRHDLVLSLRQKIEAGEYQPDVRGIARRVLEDLRDFRGA